MFTLNLIPQFSGGLRPPARARTGARVRARAHHDDDDDDGDDDADDDDDDDDDPLHLQRDVFSQSPRFVFS